MCREDFVAMQICAAVCGNYSSQFGPEEKKCILKGSNKKSQKYESGEYNEVKYSIYICIEFLLWKELLHIYCIM